jgi:hypothetical protein
MHVKEIYVIFIHLFDSGILLKVALNTITHAVFSTEAEELGQERKGQKYTKKLDF